MQHVVGMVVGVSLFVLLPVFLITGAFECAGAAPGLYCTLTKLAFDGPSSSNIQQLQAKIR
jgi:hypothetical protein